jgi:hypothetical protein
MQNPTHDGVLFLAVLHDAGCPAEHSQNFEDCNCHPTFEIHNNQAFYESSFKGTRAERRAAQRAERKAQRKGTDQSGGGS